MPTTWKIKTVNPNNTVEFVYWQKDGYTIISKSAYASADFLCNEEVKPVVDLTNTKGFEITFQDVNWKMRTDLDEMADYENYDETLSEFYQAVSRTWDWGTLTDTAAQEAISRLWPTPPAPSRGDREQEAWEAMEAAGWENSETATWLYGELSLEQTTDRVVPNDYDDPSYYLDDETP